MKRSAILVLSLLVFLTVSVALSAEDTNLPAFPGAEGFGAYARGGRGGKVLFVTNLKDSGAGSLRAAINSSGPRTIIFKVSGTIELKSRLVVDNPYLTIAGQTAPGEGICLKNYSLIIDAHDVIVRYLRVRPGEKLLRIKDDVVVHGSIDAITIHSHDVIIDHCSASWGIDEVVSPISRSDKVTIQWSIIAEGPLPHSKGSLIAPKVDSRMTFHHNLFAHNVTRNPGVGPYDNVNLQLIFKNNVIYNWKTTAGTSFDRSTNADIDYLKNYLRTGPSTPDNNRNYAFYFGIHKTSIYQANNIVNGKEKGWKIIKGEYSKRNSPLSVDEKYKVNTSSANRAYGAVLENVGATLPKRDSVDKRVIRSVKNKTGRIINSPREVGGWPSLETYNKKMDSDRDGMPDSWEKRKGLDKDDPTDRNGDMDGDGYTNLEEYLHSLVRQTSQSQKPSSPTAPGESSQQKRKLRRKTD